MTHPTPAATDLGKRLTRLRTKAGDPSYGEISRTLLVEAHIQISDQQIGNYHKGTTDPRDIRWEVLYALTRFYGCKPADLGRGAAEQIAALEDLAKKTTTTTSTTTTTVEQGPVEVGRWSGNADTDTENFTVVDSWELHWRFGGQYGAGGLATWYTPQNEIPAGYVQMPDGEDLSLVRVGGTFYLHLQTFGSDYEVWVIDVPN